MPKTITTRNQEVFSQPIDSLTSQFVNSLDAKIPYESIVDFASHHSFCGIRLYPRQKTLLKLIYLETENMTAYDIDVIENWRTHFTGGKDSFGVQPDVWERIEYLKQQGYRHFPHVQAVMGRRASKGVIGGILGAEKMAHLVSLDDWQAHYGIARNKDCYLNVIATNSIQAKKNQFADIRSTVESCEYLKKYISSDKEYYISLRTPADLRLLAEMHAQRIPIEHEIASVRCLAVSSTSSSGRGSVSVCNFFDEFAHMLTGTGGPRSSEQVYSAYQPSLDDFGKDSLTYMPSSPYTKIGHFYELYVSGCVLLPQYLSKHSALDPELIRQNMPIKSTEDDELEDLEIEDLTADPEMLIVQLPSWDLYTDFELSPKLGGPRFKRALQVYDDRMKRLERRNPTKFKVEKKAQFAEVEDAYLDPDKVDLMFTPFWNGRTLDQAEYGTMAYVYEGHADPSKVNANFAVCIAHLERSPIPDIRQTKDSQGNEKVIEQYWDHVIIDHLHVWKPSDYPDHTLDYVEITDYLAALIGKYPAMKEFTFDAWNSAGPIASLRKIFPTRPRIRVEEFNEKNNTKRAEYFKSAINLGWIHSFKDTFFGEGQSLLEQELKFLIEKNGKIEKQTIGPVTTKDLADTVMETSYRLLHHQLDQHEKALMGKMKMGKGMPGGQVDPMNNPALTPAVLSQLGAARSHGFTTGGPGAARERLQARREQIHNRRRRGTSGFRSR
jgi:hypothetical protein